MRSANLDEQFIQLLELCEQQLIELKTGNQLTGGNNIIYRTSVTSFAYDWTGQLPAGGRRYLLVTAQSKAGSALFASITSKLYRNGSWYRPSDELAAQKVGQTSAFVYIRPTGTPTATTSQWLAEINGNTTDTYSVKFYVSGSARATLSVQETSL